MGLSHPPSTAHGMYKGTGEGLQHAARRCDLAHHRGHLQWIPVYLSGFPFLRVLFHVDDGLTISYTSNLRPRRMVATAVGTHGFRYGWQLYRRTGDESDENYKKRLNV